MATEPAVPPGAREALHLARDGGEEREMADEGETVPLDAYHWHEALDRSLLALEFFDRNVAEHPAIRQTPELRRDAEEIADRLFRLYQALGGRTPGRPDAGGDSDGARDQQERR